MTGKLEKGQIITITAPTSCNDEIAVFYSPDDDEARLEKVQMWALVEHESGDRCIEGISFRRDGNCNSCCQDESFVGYARTVDEADQLIQIVRELHALENQDGGE